MERKDLKRKVLQGRMAHSLCDCARAEVEQVMQDTKKDVRKTSNGKKNVLNVSVTVAGLLLTNTKLLYKTVN